MLSLLVGFVSTQTIHAQSTEQTQTSSQAIILDVQNMSCGMCPITVRKALQNVNGVQSATVDFESKTAHVTFDPNKTDIETLINATSNVGYPATVHTEK